MLLTFTGQLTGTSAGAKLYERGGWVASGSLSVAFIGLTFLICLARGPYEPGWIGWKGGWNVRKKNLAEATSGPMPIAVAEPMRDEEAGEQVPVAVLQGKRDGEASEPPTPVTIEEAKRDEEK